MNRMLNRRGLTRSEDGAVLLTVTLVSVFVFAVVLAIAGSSALTSKLTNTSRSTLEAFAAAESGRDAALNEFMNSRCTQSVTTTTDPIYTYRVYRYTATGSEIPTRTSDPGVTLGCPEEDTSHVLVEVVGRDNRGVTKTIMSTYKWNPGTVTVLYGALVSGATSNISGAGVVLPQGATVPGDVVVGDGDLKCSNSVVQGSVYVLNGSLDLQGCTRVSGNTSSKTWMKFSNNGSRVVDGNACTHGYFSNYASGKVGGTALSFQATCAGDNISPWNDYNPSLVGAVTLPSSLCGGGSGLASFILNFTSPTIINATGCSNMRITTAIRVQTDVSIVANSYTANNPGAFTSYDGGPHVFNLIVPDRVKTDPADAHWD